MVISGVGREGREEGGERFRNSMAMGPQRSKPLHNFSMPSWLKWGSQRALRCANTISQAEEGSDDNNRRSFPVFEYQKSSVTGGWYRGSDLENRRSPEPSKLGKSSLLEKQVIGSKRVGEAGEGDDGGIDAVRTKVMQDIKTAADEMKVSILRKGEEEEVEEQSTTVAASTTAERPWNLRTRRAACKAPNGNGKSTMRIEERIGGLSPVRTSESPAKSPRPQRGNGGSVSGNTGEKSERAKFSVTLTRKEIEQDYLQILGEKPPRRPKKRPRNVQRHLNSLFPGLWLTEVTAEMYKVSEVPESGKK